jgi:hypothetical protein
MKYSKSARNGENVFCTLQPNLTSEQQQSEHIILVTKKSFNRRLYIPALLVSLLEAGLKQDL